MGLLNNLATKGVNALGLNTSAELTSPPKPDFPEGFIIREYVKGRFFKPNEDGYGLILAGSFMPMRPFEYGGTQQITKDYYHGTSEPTVQVHGARENDLIIKGKFHAKRLNKPNTPDGQIVSNPTLLVQKYGEQVDKIRRRGNMLELQMGEWIRYAVMEEGKFVLNRLVEVEYEIKFSIIGLKPPTGCKFIQPKADNISSSNSDIIAASANAVANVQNFPSTMPRSLADFLNDKISDVADVIANVTGFVDDILNDADSILNSANRALGLIKYARAYVSRTMRQLGVIAKTTSNLGSTFSSEADKTAATIKNAKFINDTKTQLFSLAVFLAALQKKFEGISKTLPVARHFVVQNDTLQKISIKYYGNADGWKKIYDHNKLTSTELQKGTVLEIPK